jgi:Flp pilus assembly protein TadG
MTCARHTRTSRRFCTANEGVSAIEFALIAPVFVLILMAVVEYSMVMFATSVLEGATLSSSRYGKTGYVAAGSTRQQQIIAAITERSSGLLDASRITMTTKVYSAFDKVGDPEPYTDSNGNGMYNLGEAYTDVNGNAQWDSDMGSAGLGNSDDVVVYTVSYPWTIHTPIIRQFLGSTYTITSRTVVKNEPYCQINCVGG